NIAEKGFPISVYNRTTSKVDETVQRAKLEGNLPLYGFHDPASFVNSIQKPRVVIMLVKAGAPVDQTIATLAAHLEQGDCIVDGGNEWYENTERREKAMEERGLLYLGMGVSGGEEGARHGPSMMPGGSLEAYQYIEDILLKVSAQVPDSGPCVTYIGKGGSGNFVKMVHNGIEYGDMQLIAEAYDVLKSVGKLTNGELQQVFTEWNKGELLSFLVEITADIFSIKDDQGEGYLVDKVLDKTGMKGTGKWTVQQAAELSVAAPTIEASLDSRFLSGLKDERVAASKIFQGDYSSGETVDKAQLIEDVRKALYASKICSYAQGMNIIKAPRARRRDGASTSASWPGSGRAGASSAPASSTASRRPMTGTVSSPTSSSTPSSRRRSWTGKPHGGGSSASPSTTASAPLACPRVWPTLTPTGGTGFLQTLSRPRGTTSGRTPTRGLTCPAPSTPSGTRSPTRRSKMLLLLYQETAHHVSSSWYPLLLPVMSPFPNPEGHPEEEEKDSKNNTHR
uniref:6-phosphogluconate dehydrogenase, decarboxylating n=1 Tax=Aegilops tauschii subsp. strangulata TaxID=200361 RepID=A0A453GND4_AEGTS